eukprot:COSAG01_NODE_2158_length_8251_cov_8.554645_1_plen_59_part_00
MPQPPPPPPRPPSCADTGGAPKGVGAPPNGFSTVITLFDRWEAHRHGSGWLAGLAPWP